MASVRTDIQRVCSGSFIISGHLDFTARSFLSSDAPTATLLRLKFVAAEALPRSMSHFIEWSHFRQMPLIALIVELYLRSMVTTLAWHLGHWRLLRYLTLIFDGNSRLLSL